MDLVNRILTNDPGSKLVIMSETNMHGIDVTTITDYENALISMIVPMINPMIMATVADVIRARGLVMEMVLLYDPMECHVRVRNATLNPNSRRLKTLMRVDPGHMTGIVSAITRTIRPMNINNMCYECVLVLSIARSIAMMYRGTGADDIPERQAHWSDIYAGISQWISMTWRTRYKHHTEHVVEQFYHNESQEVRHDPSFRRSERERLSTRTRY